MLDARSNEIFALFKILQQNSYTNKYYKFELPTSFAKYILKLLIYLNSQTYKKNQHDAFNIFHLCIYHVLSV